MARINTHRNQGISIFANFVKGIVRVILKKDKSVIRNPKLEKFRKKKEQEEVGIILGGVNKGKEIVKAIVLWSLPVWRDRATGTIFHFVPPARKSKNNWERYEAVFIIINDEIFLLELYLSNHICAWEDLVKAQNTEDFIPFEFDMVVDGVDVVFSNATTISEDSQSKIEKKFGPKIKNIVELVETEMAGREEEIAELMEDY